MQPNVSYQGGGDIGAITDALCATWTERPDLHSVFGSRELFLSTNIESIRSLAASNSKTIGEVFFSSLFTLVETP